MLLLFLALAILAGVSNGCPREPSIYHSRVFKTPGDNGFQIKINENPEKYIPGTIYTMYLMANNTLDDYKTFRRFIINVESTNDPGNLSPQKVGSFQLFGDSQSRFNEECVNTISDTNGSPKSEVFFMWTAPPPGSGCVTFRAMVLVDKLHWYADDGGLSRTFCERTENDMKFDENDCCACDEAKYDLIFEGIWSNKTHPKDFPFSLWLTHFSDVIGASHERNFSFWGPGQYASEGFRFLAEWGSVRLMETELRAKSKYLRTIIKANGLWYPKVNTNTSTTFKVDRRHHLVSLASMFGPSPDWVVGVNGLNMCLKNCSWIENLVVDLYPYDAGTDNGITYMSPNSETKPREKIFRITTKYPEDPRAPFYDMHKDELDYPLARFYFRRSKLIKKSCDESFLNAQLEHSENTEDTERMECAVTPYSDWNECSVSCGKGLRMRTREYVNPQKAAMFECNRQLVSKEMCVAEIAECEDGENTENDSSEEKINFDEGACATTEWTQWSACSETCGIGYRTRHRQFVDPMGRKKCPTVEIFEREKCMNPACKFSTEDVDPMCPTTQWSDWSPCSVSCGKGAQFRTKLLLVDPDLQQKCAARVQTVQQRDCVDTPSCTFDMATAKQVCMEESHSGPCEGHFQRYYFDSRKLMCVPFIYGGCKGNRNNFISEEECNDACGIVREALSKANPFQSDAAYVHPAVIQTEPPATPIDCVISEWSNWSPCSATCGLGYSERFRMVKRKAKNGGKPCPKRLTAKKRCLHLPRCEQ